MRPLELRISGLHSYAEEQVVDFAALSAYGIFGIFGPTGSGKSTILDAVILALFGEVPRASHGTLGIINQNAARAAVSFTFEAGRGPKRRRYRVERVLKRSGDYGAVTHRSRLVQISDEGEEVLADRDGSVKAMVQEILGLTADDFTRAAVLPQGRFAEFLTLRPNERRQMLERIFGLERFGDDLRRRLDAALSRAKNELDQVAAAQAELGDCSPEALEQCRRELAEARQAAGEARAELQARQKDKEEAQKVRDLQSRAATCRERLAGLEKNEEEINRLAEKLEAARRAEGMRGLFTQQESLQAGLAGRRQNLLALKEKERQLAQAARQKEEEFDRVRRQREEGEPGLLRQQTLLEAALGEEEELRAREREIVQKTEQIKSIQKELTALGARRQRSGERRREKEQRLQACRETAEKLRVPPALLEQALKARQQKEQLDRLEEEILENRRALEELREKVSSREAGKEALQNRRQRVEAELERLAQEEAAWQKEEPAPEEELARQQALLASREKVVERLFALEKEKEGAARQIAFLTAALKDLEEGLRVRRDRLSTLNRQLQAAADEVKKARLALEEARTKEAAASLAKTLVPGSPCPVCGSPLHPAPAAFLSGEIDALEAGLAGAQEREEKTRAALEEEERAVHGLQGQIFTLAPQLTPWREKMSSLEEEEAALVRQLPASWTEPSSRGPARRAELLAEAASAWQNLAQRRREWLHQKEARETEREKIKAEENALKISLARLEAELSGLRTRVTEREENEKELSRKRNEAAAALSALLDGLETADPARLEPYYNELRHRQEAEERARREAAGLEKELAVLAEEEKELDGKIRQLDSAAAALAAAKDALSSRAGESRRRLQNLTGGRAVAECLKSVRKRLADLQQMAEAAAEAAREAQEASRQVQEQKRGEEEAAAALFSQLTELNRRLAAEAARALFASAGEAKDALLEDGEKEALSQRVQAHRQEKELLVKNLEELVAELAGRRISAEEYARLEELEKAAREAWEKAYKEAVFRENLLAQLESRRQRWCTLEEKRKVLSRRHELLNELNRLLRARALVDFLARRQLENLVEAASARLARLTGYRYALEVDGQGGLILRDDHHGRRRRPVSSLSGGETFQASLALALALSEQIQRRSQASLEFFFLDEGFGSLDEHSLQTVMDTLERLPAEKVVIGLISHLPQMRQRLPRRLIVEPPVPGGRGSRVRLETG